MRKKSESKTSYVQFDEIETSHRTQLLPLAIAFAVRPKTGDIITAHVAPIESRQLQRIARRKYGFRESKREQAVCATLRDVREVVMDENGFTIASDSWLKYPEWIHQEIPFANHERHSGENLKTREKAMALVDFDGELVDWSETEDSGQYWMKVRKNGRRVVKAFDPLFCVNQKCARLRSALSRLRKHWWGYTQKIEYLEHHLWLFIAVNNGYSLRY